MKDWLIEGWQDVLKFWSVRVALFWGCVSGLYLAWPAFAGAMSPVVYAAISIVMAAAIAVARVLNQPGLPD